MEMASSKVIIFTRSCELMIILENSLMTFSDLCQLKVNLAEVFAAKGAGLIKTGNDFLKR